MDPLHAATIRFGILLLITPAFALLLRASGFPGRAPGAAILGGILCGVLAGPLVLGSIKSSLFDSLHVGAEAERTKLAAVDRDHERELVAMSQAGVSPVAIEERKKAQALEREPFVVARDIAIIRHREPTRLLAAALVGLAFFLGSIFARRRKPRLNDLREVPPAMGAGLLVALVTTLGTAVLVSWILELDRSSAVMIGAATAAGSAFTHMPLRWVGFEGRRIAANAINVFAFVASMLVLILMIEDDARVFIMAPVAGIFFGGLLRGRLRSTRTRRRLARAAVLWLLCAPLTAYLVSEVDPRLVMDSWRTWTFVLLALALAGMGHLLGATLALKLFGTARQQARAMSVWLESHALGVSCTQAMFLVVLVASGVLDGRTPQGTAVVVGLMLGIGSVEMTMGLLRGFVREPVAS